MDSQEWPAMLERWARLVTNVMLRCFRIRRTIANVDFIDEVIYLRDNSSEESDPRDENYFLCDAEGWTFPRVPDTCD